MNIIRFYEDLALADICPDGVNVNDDGNLTLAPNATHLEAIVRVVLAAVENKPSRSSTIAKIRLLESKQHRVIREAVLSGNNTALIELDKKILAIRSQL